MSNLLTRTTLDWQDTAHAQISSSISNATVHQIPRPNLSNRCSFCIRNVFPTPTIAMSPSIGIDKIAVEIPLATGMGDPNLFLSSIKNTLMGRWATKATTKHQGTGATIRWQFIKARWSIRLELNPSRFVDPDGYSLASPSSTVHVIKEVIKEFMLESDDALPLSLKGISSAFAAAQSLVDLATEQANSAADERNEKEIDDLSLAYGKGATGRGMASGGSKAIKELEKEQKTRSTRMVRDGLDAALLDIATFYRDVMMVQAGSNDGLINKELENEIIAYAANNKPQATINKIGAIMEARVNLGHNAAPLLTIEALMCVLAR